MSQKRTKPKVNRRKEIKKIREQITKIETKNTIEKINETKSWFFEKINKFDKPLARFTKKKRERTQLNKIRNEKEYSEQLHANKLDNQEEMDKFLETYNTPRLNTDGQWTREKMLISREMQIKTTRYHLTPVRMTIIKKSLQINVIPMQGGARQG